MNATAILLVNCPDQPGIIARLSTLVFEQDIIRVSHRDTVEDLVRKGRDLERVALSRAVRLHLQHRVLTYNNRTVVFE